jgi:hypothetical protein
MAIPRFHLNIRSYVIKAITGVALCQLSGIDITGINSSGVDSSRADSSGIDNM